MERQDLAEEKRLHSLQNLNVLDTHPEDVFDGLVEAASIVCGVPISLISLIDKDRQWFKANTGLPGVTETPRDQAFCAYTIRSADIMEVSDATLDPRFNDNPLVEGDPEIRFYAGAPLTLSNGDCVGSLCVIDRQPRTLNDSQRTVLKNLADAAVKLLESHRVAEVMVNMQTEVSADRKRLQNILNGTGAGTWEWNIQTGEFRVDDRLKEISGHQGEPIEPTIEIWRALLHPEDLVGSDQLLRQHLEGKVERFEFERRIRHPDGNWFWIYDCGQVVSHSPDGKPEWMFGIRLDIHDKKMQTIALGDSRERHAHATRRTALTRERLRLTREINDGLVHTAMGLLTQIRLVRSMHNRVSAEELESELNQLEEEAVRSVSAARDSVAHLRFNDVRDVGLGPSIEALVKRKQTFHDISVDLSLSDDAGKLADQRAESVFRVAEGALDDIITHSKARSASLTLATDAELTNAHGDMRLKFSVTFDDTLAINETQSPMLAIEEQAALLGTVPTIKEMPSGETNILVVIEPTSEWQVAGEIVTEEH